MKKKNLGLKIAALLLSFGGFAAVNSVSNSTFAMEKNPSSNLNQSLKEEEQKKYKDLYHYPVNPVNIDKIENAHSIKLPDLELCYDEILTNKIDTNFQYLKQKFYENTDPLNSSAKPFLDPSALKRTLNSEDFKDRNSDISDELLKEPYDRNLKFQKKLISENPTADNQSLTDTEVADRQTTSNDSGNKIIDYGNTSLKNQIKSINKLIAEHDKKYREINEIKNENMEIGEVKTSGNNITNKEVEAVKNFVEKDMNLKTFKHTPDGGIEYITLDNFKNLFYSKYAGLYNEHVKTIHAIRNYLEKLKSNLEYENSLEEQKEQERLKRVEAERIRKELERSERVEAERTKKEQEEKLLEEEDPFYKNESNDENNKDERDD